MLPIVRGAMERAERRDSTASAALFDEHDVRAVEPRPVTADDGASRRRRDPATNDADRPSSRCSEAVVYATVATDCFDETAAGDCSAELESIDAATPTAARPPRRLGAVRSASTNWRRSATRPREHLRPLLRLAARAAHQMSEAEEGLYAELATTGSAAWARLHSDVTSQLTTEVSFPDGTSNAPMPAVRGLATDADPPFARRRTTPSCGAWPTVAVRLRRRA